MSASLMNARLVLLAALLSTCSDSRETSDDRVQKIHTSAGEVVFLPCQIDVPYRKNLTVEWSKEDLVPKIYTFVYRDGFEDLATKNKDFQNRTSLFVNIVQNRSILLRISNVRLSDAGKHECSIILNNKRNVMTTLELIVSKDTKSCKVGSFVADAVVVFPIDVVDVFVAVVAFAAGIGVRYPFVFLRNKVRSYCAGRNIPPECNQPSVQSPDNQESSSFLMENQTDSPTVISEL